MNLRNSGTWTWKTEPSNDPYGFRVAGAEEPARKKRISGSDYMILASLLEQVYAAPSLEERVRELETRLAAQERLMAELFEPPKPQQKGSFEDWLETSEAEKYAGSNVIYIVGQGVVKSAKDITELVGDERLSRAGVILGHVPGS